MTTFFSKLKYACRFLAMSLWLSVSSPDFYIEVHKKFRGYGIRYVLILYLISGIIFCLWSFSSLIILENSISPTNPEVDYVLKQIPNMKYDGYRLTTDAEMPMLIYSKKGNKVGAIDINGELNDADLDTIPFVFRDHYVRLPVKLGINDNADTDAEYKYLLGTEAMEINYDSVITALPNLWRNMNKVYIYILTPLVGLVYFGSVLLLNIPYAIFLWLMSYFWGGFGRGNSASLVVFDTKDKGATSLQTAYRMSMFASGAPVFLQPIAFIISPSLSPVIMSLSVISWIIMVMGLSKVIKQARGAI